jgi:hypothetical protein
MQETAYKLPAQHAILFDSSPKTVGWQIHQSILVILDVRMNHSGPDNTSQCQASLWTLRSEAGRNNEMEWGFV